MSLQSVPVVTCVEIIVCGSVVTLVLGGIVVATLVVAVVPVTPVVVLVTPVVVDSTVPLVDPVVVVDVVPVVPMTHIKFISSFINSINDVLFT